MTVLAPDVTLLTDGGGKARAALRPIIGAAKAARFLAAIAGGPYMGLDIADMTLAEPLGPDAEIGRFRGLVVRGWADTPVKTDRFKL
jgi:hypothetical protein